MASDKHHYLRTTPSTLRRLPDRARSNTNHESQQSLVAPTIPLVGLILCLIAFLTIPALMTIARADEAQIQQFTDPKHPGMLAWRIDYVLPEDAIKPKIELDYDYWDPKVEGDAFSKRHLNSAKIDSNPGTLSFVILLSPKESLIALNGKEFRGQGTSLIKDTKVKIASHPTLDSGTGGFMLLLKPNPKTPPDQIDSYFDLDSWVLLTIRFSPD